MATIHRQLALPEGGSVFCFGPRPTIVEIREVPQEVSNEDLKALLDAVCATPQGLMLGRGEGFEGTFYSINYVVLCREAEKAGVPVPMIPERPKVSPPYPRIIDGVPCNEHGQPLARPPAEEGG